MTAPGIGVSGFCSSFCAYHTKTTVSGITIHYALVPEPNAKCTACDGNFAVYGDKTTPNGDPGADEMVDSLMHEISETVTDPDINAWLTSNGEEAADLCNYNYASSYLATTTAPDGSMVHYNFTVGDKNYLIQRIWKEHRSPAGVRALNGVPPRRLSLRLRLGSLLDSTRVREVCRDGRATAWHLSCVMPLILGVLKPKS